jgi:hypothetical protein
MSRDPPGPTNSACLSVPTWIAVGDVTTWWTKACARIARSARSLAKSERAWIIPGRQSQTLLEDFERERDVPVASLSDGDADYALDKEKKGRPVPVFAPEHEAVSGHGWRTPRSPPAPSRPVKMSADVGCGDGNRGCQCRRHCRSEQNAACSGDAAELRGGCVKFCSGRREMSSSVFARVSSGLPPGSVLFAENKLTTAASTKTAPPPTTPSPSQPRRLSFGARRQRRGPESPSSFVFFEEAAAARVKKRARLEDEEDCADGSDKDSASHENEDEHDGGRDSCPRAPPSKKKRAAPAAAVPGTAFAKKRARIEDDDDDDRVADPFAKKRAWIEDESDDDWLSAFLWKRQRRKRRSRRGPGVLFLQGGRRLSEETSFLVVAANAAQVPVFSVQRQSARRSQMFPTGARLWKRVKFLRPTLRLPRLSLLQPR